MSSVLVMSFQTRLCLASASRFTFIAIVRLAIYRYEMLGQMVGRRSYPASKPIHLGPSLSVAGTDGQAKGLAK